MQKTQETQIQSFDGEDPLKVEIATRSSILAWETSWTEGAWRATVHGVAKSQTRLKQLSIDKKDSTNTIIKTDFTLILHHTKVLYIFKDQFKHNVLKSYRVTKLRICYLFSQIGPWKPEIYPTKEYIFKCLWG